MLFIICQVNSKYDVRSQLRQLSTAEVSSEFSTCILDENAADVSVSSSSDSSFELCMFFFVFIFGL